MRKAKWRDGRDPGSRLVPRQAGRDGLFGWDGTGISGKVAANSPLKDAQLVLELTDQSELCEYVAECQPFVLYVTQSAGVTELV